MAFAKKSNFVNVFCYSWFFYGFTYFAQVLSMAFMLKEEKGAEIGDQGWSAFLQTNIFSILTNIKTPCVGWTTVQLLHRHIAQVNPKFQSIFSVCSDSKCKVWVSIIFAHLWLSVKSNLSSQVTKLNLWLPISTKMLPSHAHISGWPCTRLTPKTISNHHLLLGAQFS